MANQNPSFDITFTYPNTNTALRFQLDWDKEQRRVSLSVKEPNSTSITTSMAGTISENPDFIPTLEHTVNHMNAALRLKAASGFLVAIPKPFNGELKLLSIQQLSGQYIFDNMSGVLQQLAQGDLPQPSGMDKLTPVLIDIRSSLGLAINMNARKHTHSEGGTVEALELTFMPNGPQDSAALKCVEALAKSFDKLTDDTIGLVGPTLPYLNLSQIKLLITGSQGMSEDEFLNAIIPPLRGAMESLGIAAILQAQHPKVSILEALGASHKEVVSRVLNEGPNLN